MTAVRKASALKHLDAMFDSMSLEGAGRRSPLVTIEHDAKCDVHGRQSPYRSSLYLFGREPSPAFRRESISPNPGGFYRRRDSLGIPASPPTKDLEHPADFPSYLRRDSITKSRETPSPTPRLNPNRNSVGSYASLRKSPANNKRDSTPSNIRRDYVSTHALNRKDSTGKKASCDSLDSWHVSWDTTGRRQSLTSDLEDTMQEERLTKYKKGTGKLSGRDDGGPSPGTGFLNGANGVPGDASARPAFKRVTVLEDLQAVRCAEFHPHGKVYAVGSNTKTLRICAYPKIDDFAESKEPAAPVVVFKRTKHHKGSIYCVAWSPAGDLLATGSNDKTAKLMRFNADTCNLDGQEVELGMHDGTVRDVCFIEDTSNKASLLLSAGAGDCKVYVTDCATGKPFQALGGHSGHVLSLYNWGGAMFVSASQDKTVRFWDLRTGGCVNIISPSTVSSSRGAPVAAVAVDPSGRLLVSGHEDGCCSLYDVRGARPLHQFKPHVADVRSVCFSPGAYYLLTAGYDGRILLTDLQGDLTRPLPKVLVARHPDKIISSRWHPEDFSFVSTSADKTAVLWTIPPV